MFERKSALTLVCFMGTTSLAQALQAPGPISLPVTQFGLGNSQSMRGVPMTIGTPPQNFSFMPNDFLNDTWVYNSKGGFCTATNGSNASSAFCITYRGGLFNINASSSFKAATDACAAGGDPSDTERALGLHIWNSTWATDDLSFGDITLPAFPIGMPNQSFGQSLDTRNNFGVGRNSTILSALFDAGKIASRSWSWWWGQTGATTNALMDGSITFGGYDAAKTIGAPFKNQLMPPELECLSGMQVTISGIVLNFLNGSTFSLLGPDQQLGCLQPGFSALIAMPQSPYFERFESFTQTQSVDPAGAHMIDNTGTLYDAGSAFTGSLTIVLNNEFSVEIPNDLLVVPPKTVENNGFIFTNTDFSEVLINPTTGPSAYRPMMLGGPFFSSAYLSVDFDDSSFTLWTANATNDTNLVPIGHHCASDQSNRTGGSTNCTGGADGQSSKNHTIPSKDLSIAAIEGIAVGGAVGALALGAGVTFWYLRKRKNRLIAERIPSAEYRRSSQELEGYYDPKRFQWNEPLNNEALEMTARPDPGELAGASKPAEMNAELRWPQFKQSLARNNHVVELE